MPRGEQAHAYLWLRLSNCGHPDLTHCGTELNELRRSRNWADYDENPPLDQATATAYVQSARDTVQLLALAATMPTVLQPITDTMRIYERDVLGQVTWQP